MDDRAGLNGSIDHLRDEADAGGKSPSISATVRSLGASPRGPQEARRALVTGAAGFLGSHLCDHLLAEGRRVMGIDNLMTGRQRNLAHLRDHPRFEFAFHDVLTPFTGQFDEIWHLACPASPPAYQADPVATARIAFEGTLNMLSLARGSNARIFIASTSEVYGDPDVHPQREDYLGAVNPTGPRACYDEGKRIAETLAFDFHRMHGTPVRVARIFNTYGPRMNVSDGRVVSNFIVQALTGEDITLYGNGEQTRSFCYVDDLIEGFMALMESDEIGPVNLGNPGEFTVRELAERVLDMTGAGSRLVFRDLPQDDPRRRRPDIGRAVSTLGWRPHVDLETGLRRTIAGFTNELVLDGVIADRAGGRREADVRSAPSLEPPLTVGSPTNVDPVGHDGFRADERKVAAGS